MLYIPKNFASRTSLYYQCRLTAEVNVVKVTCSPIQNGFIRTRLAALSASSAHTCSSRCCHGIYRLSCCDRTTLACCFPLAANQPGQHLRRAITRAREGRQRRGFHSRRCSSDRFRGTLPFELAENETTGASVELTLPHRPNPRPCRGPGRFHPWGSQPSCTVILSNFTFPAAHSEAVRIIFFPLRRRSFLDVPTHLYSLTLNADTAASYSIVNLPTDVDRDVQDGTPTRSSKWASRRKKARVSCSPAG